MKITSQIHVLTTSRAGRRGCSQCACLAPLVQESHLSGPLPALTQADKSIISLKQGSSQPTATGHPQLLLGRGCLPASH